MSTFQQGNLAAQNYLLGGMPMYEAALRGRPINYGAQQPVAINYDPSFAQQRIGGMGRMADALSGFNAGFQGPRSSIPGQPDGPQTTVCRWMR